MVTAPEEPQLKRFYVTMTWEDWPEGGSFGATVTAKDHDAAEWECKLQMADLQDLSADYPIGPERDAAIRNQNWHVVDCFDLDEFITNNMQP